MDAPIGDQAAAIIPEHAPGAVKALLVERALRRRTQPGIEIHSFWNRRIRHRRWNGRIIKIGPDMNTADRPQFSGVEVIDHFLPVSSASLLLPDLHNPFVLLGRRHHRVTPCDAITDGLLGIYILSCLAGVNELQALLVIGRADDHPLHTLAINSMKSEDSGLGNEGVD